MSLNSRYIEHFTKRAGVCALPDVADVLRQCGFDESGYFSQNIDLQQTGHDPSAALSHFLVHGIDEERPVPAAPLPDGLEGIERLDIAKRDYKERLFRAMFFAQSASAHSADRLWHEIGGEFVGRVRAMGGLPYYILGDSHADLYRRRARFGQGWLAPLLLMCPGASAIGLASETSKSGYGAKILRWAQRAAQPPGSDAPVFLKFGGLDAEFLWMSQRMDQDSWHFSLTGFRAFAERSVAQYAAFLDRLGAILGADRLRVCSVFPSALGDADWIAGFTRVFGRSEEHNRKIAQRLAAATLPPLRLRTTYRALYNSMLRKSCAERGFAFVDDFSPFLSPGGVLDAGYRAKDTSKDFHIDYAASEGPILGIIAAQLGLGGTSDPLAQSAAP